MIRSGCLVLLAFVLGLFTDAQAFAQRLDLDAVNHRILGLVVDHTANHGTDRRIWSPSLGQKRDLYVYLPPGFDPKQRYPVMFWLHSILADERQFVHHAIPHIDAQMACGKLPPMIIVIPDGMKHGRVGLFATHSAFLNSRLGNFEDYLFCDLWNFVTHNYPIRPERKAHVLAGISMGGGAAYFHAIKHRDRFGVALGIFPPLNIRWLDCHGRYFGNFDPCCWGWREKVWCGHEPIGKFYGIIRIPLRRVVFPLYGRGPRAVEMLKRSNPIEMLDQYNVRPGELSMYVAYGGLDEFNIDAQVESFLFHAKQRGLCVAVTYAPKGRHDSRTAFQFMPAVIDWLAPQVAPYSPPMVLPVVEP